MKKMPPATVHSVPARRRSNTKAAQNGKVAVSKKAIISRLVTKHELSELEASWLLKAWELGGVSKMRERFACYLAGFMAGIAFKTVEHEVKSTRN